MSYLRGNYYLWRDGEDRLHIWAADGYDGWDDSVWAMDSEGVGRRDGREAASGVSVPQSVMDEFVVMRFAQMLVEGTVNTTIDRVVGPDGQGGNFGGTVLKQHAATLKTAFAGIQLERPDAPSVTE